MMEETTKARLAQIRVDCIETIVAAGATNKPKFDAQRMLADLYWALGHLTVTDKTPRMWLAGGTSNGAVSHWVWYLGLWQHFNCTLRERDIFVIGEKTEEPEPLDRSRPIWPCTERDW